MQVVELREVLLQVCGKIYAPSCLHNPDGVSWPEIVGAHKTLPLLGEIVRPKHPCGPEVAGDDLMAAAGELFEVGGRYFEGNGMLLAQIVAKDEIGLVIGEDEIGKA